MNTAIRIIKNAVSLVISLGLDRLVDMVLVVYIARFLGAESLGEYTVILSLTAVFQTIALFGLNEMTIRELARDHQQLGKYLVNLTAIGICTGVGGALLFVVTVNWLNYDAAIIRYAYAAAMALIFITLAQLTEAIIKAIERMEFVPVIRFGSNLIKVVLSIVLLSQGGSLFAVFMILALTQALMLGLYILLGLRLQGRPSLAFDRKFNQRLLHISIPFFFLSILSVIDKQSSIIFLSKLLDVQSSGEYAAAQKVLEMGQLMMPALLVAIFPSLSNLFATARAQFVRVVRITLRFLFILSLPVAISVTLLAPEIIFLLYGAEGYDQSAVILRVLIWRLVLFAINAVLYRTVLASNNEKVSIRIAAVSMTVRIVLSLYLIPQFGGIGAAVSDIVGVIVGVLQNAFFIHRHLFSITFKTILIKPLLAAFMMGIVGLLLYRIQIVAAFVVSVGVYVAVLFAVKAITDNDRYVLKTIWDTLSMKAHTIVDRTAAK